MPPRFVASTPPPATPLLGARQAVRVSSSTPHPIRRSVALKARCKHRHSYDYTYRSSNCDLCSGGTSLVLLTLDAHFWCTRSGAQKCTGKKAQRCSMCRTAPRCGLSMFEITRCGAVRCGLFLGESYGTVRCGAVRCGAVFTFAIIIWCGRCGFLSTVRCVAGLFCKNHTVRRGAVIRSTVGFHGAAERAPWVEKTVYPRVP